MELRLIQPKKSTHNEYIESLTDDYKDEFLEGHWLSDIAHARKIIHDWWQDYNECRPHSFLNYKTSSKFAARWRSGKVDSKKQSLLTQGCTQTWRQIRDFNWGITSLIQCVSG